MATLWMRLGVAASFTQEEIDILRHYESPEDNEKAKEVILKAFTEGRMKLDGETYVPMKDGFDWDFYF